jgi:hypothetical protein
VTQQACWTPSTHKNSARPGRTTAGHKSKLLSPADVNIIKPPTLHSALKKEYGAKIQHFNVRFAPTEQVCLFYKQRPACHCKNKLLSPADVNTIKPPTLHSALKKKCGAKKQRRNVTFAPTEQVCLFYKQFPAWHCTNKLLSPADVNAIKPPTLHSSKKKYGAKKQRRNVTFAPTEKMCIYNQDLLPCNSLSSTQESLHQTSGKTNKTSRL